MDFGQGIEKMIQMDKSTCHSNNRDVGIFGYPGKPTVDATLLLEDIAADYVLFISVIVQPSQSLDFNACDAPYHSFIKSVAFDSTRFRFVKKTFHEITI